jgi:hypothetical protein
METTRPVDNREVPEGYHLTAVPVSSLESSGEWRLVTGKRCRASAGMHRKACGQPSAVELNRGTTHRPAWFAYCSDPAHMYGKWVEDGQVMCWILEADRA